eukprot:756889-Hanusia_phi.AAC.2
MISSQQRYRYYDPYYYGYTSLPFCPPLFRLAFALAACSIAILQSAFLLLCVRSLSMHTLTHRLLGHYDRQGRWVPPYRSYDPYTGKEEEKKKQT